MEDNKAKSTKKFVIRGKLKFEHYINCLKANKLEVKMNHLEKIKIDIDQIKENHKEFIRNTKLILKTQQRF